MASQTDWMTDYHKIDKIQNLGGMNREQAIQILNKSSGDIHVAIDLVLQLNESRTKTTNSQQAADSNVNMNASMMNDAQYAEAVKKSLQPGESSGHDARYEKPIQERVRKNDEPVGLSNVGNTCYLSSLLQCYYSIPSFVKTIFKFQTAQVLKGKDELQTKKIESGRALITELQRAFAYMTIGKQNYFKPVKIIQSMVNDWGDNLEHGDQCDIREFNEIFISRITDALEALQKHKQDTQSMSETPGNPDLFNGLAEFNSLLKGDAIQRRSYKDLKTGQMVEKLQSDNFYNILLQLEGEHDIYAAWEKYHRETMDFQPIKGEPTVKLDISNWIQKSPKILILQLNRTKFTQDGIKKLIHQVKIENQICPQRFMFKNREKVEQNRSQVENWRVEQKQISHTTDQFKRYKFKERENELLYSIQLVKHLVESQERFSGQIQQYQSPHQILNEKLQADCKQILATLEATVLIKMEDQEMMSKKLSNQISNSFKELETAEETYELHAICVHDGGAESGHYFTFIKDHKKNIWFKFNDDKINIVDQDIVSAQSDGGHGYMTAFWVIYMSKSEIIESNNHDLNLYKYTENKLYIDLIKECCPHFMQEINDANEVLEKEFQNYEDEIKCKSIKDQLNKRQTEIYDLFTKKTPEEKQIVKNNSIFTYLFLERDDLFTKVVLQQLFEEISKETTITQEQFERIKQKYEQMYKQQLRRLNEHEIKELRAQHEVLKVPQFCLKITNLLLNSILKKDFTCTLKIIEFSFNVINQYVPSKEKAQFERFKSLTLAFGLILCTEIRDLVVKLGQDENILQNQENVIAYYLLLVKLIMYMQGYPQTQIYQSNLENTLNKFQKVFQRHSIYDKLNWIVQHFKSKTYQEQEAMFQYFSKELEPKDGFIDELLSDIYHLMTEFNPQKLPWKSHIIKKTLVYSFSINNKMYKDQYNSQINWNKRILIFWQAKNFVNVQLPEELMCGKDFIEQIPDQIIPPQSNTMF